MERAELNVVIFYVIAILVIVLLLALSQFFMLDAIWRMVLKYAVQ